MKTGEIVTAKVDFTGSYVEELNVAGRMTICNMAVEMGAKTAYMQPNQDVIDCNSINLGLLPVICRGIRDKVTEGQTLTLDLEKGTVTVEETGDILPCEQLGEQAMKILEAGGIKPMMRRRF